MLTKTFLVSKQSKPTVKPHFSISHIMSTPFTVCICERPGDNVHPCNRPCHCPVCDVRCSSTGNLIRHAKKDHVHPDSERIIDIIQRQPHSCVKCLQKCPLCDFKGQAQPLASHMATHTMYYCPECGKAFKKPSLLKYHVLKHGKAAVALTHECTICHKICKTSANLSLHMTAHDTHKCAVCDKVCRKIGDLTTHMRSHTGERPFSCDHCGKHFISNRTLQIHYQTVKCVPDLISVSPACMTLCVCDPQKPTCVFVLD